MKICLASHAPFIAGAEIAVERLAVGLRDLGHEVFLVVGSEGEAYARFRHAGIRCMYCPLEFTSKLFWWRYMRARSRLIEILRREKPDIVHSNDLPTHQMVSDAARRVRISRVCHHRWIFEGSAIDWFNKYGAELHLFVSQALMETLCAESTRLRASARAVVYDGLPIPQLPTPSARRDMREKLGVAPDKLIVLFAGQVIERKGIADLLRGWALLFDRWERKAELIVVGDDVSNAGEYRRQMELLAAELHCFARFVGFQNNVPEWLTIADLAIVPSHAEPLGNATLEAMAYGLPVVGANVGGIPEMIVDNETGLLIPPHAPKTLSIALDTLLADRSLRLKMGAAGRRRGEHLFSLTGHAESVLDQYRLLM
jgi:glycosyltransferase involved in cell wall biosynthesis